MTDSGPREQPAPLGLVGRIGRAVGLALVVAYVLLMGLTVARRGGPVAYVVASDLICTFTGAAILEHGPGTGLYDRATQTAEQATILRLGGLQLQHVLPYIHPPMEALLFAPLHAAGLSYVVLFGFWTLVNLAALAGSVWLLGYAWPLPTPGATLTRWAALTFLPVFTSVLLGQNSLLLLLACAGASVALRQGQDGRAGAILALAAIKPPALPVVLLVLLIMRRWRALATFTALMAAVLVGTLPLLGWDWPVRYTQLILSVGGYPPDPTLQPEQMQNWRGLLVRLLGDTPTANTLASILSLGSIALVVWLWLGAGNRGRWRPGTPDWDRRWAATLLAAILSAPYVLPHDLVPALVPGWILAAGTRDRRAHLWLGLGWLSGLTALFPGLPLPPTVLWMAVTVAGLAWMGRPGPPEREGTIAG